MKIFISWSGSQSKRVALALRSWLPDVLQTIAPWMSAADIGAGARWNREVEAQLSSTTFGILCLTRDNLESPWLLFEAGALAKSIEQSRVCPYLLDLDSSDIPSGPLTQFQAKRANEEETFQLLESINNALGEGMISPDSLERAFKLWWPQFQERLEEARDETPAPPTQRPMQEVLNEVLNEVRSISRRLPKSESELAREAEIRRVTAQHSKIEAVVFAAPEIVSRGITRSNAAWGDDRYMLHPTSPRGQLNARVDLPSWHQQSDDVLREQIALPLVAKLVAEFESKTV